MLKPHEVLTTVDLAVGYGRGRHATPILAGLSLVLRRGELVCLLGANGAGKTTLMRTLAGMQPPIHGEVCIDGESTRTLPPLELARRVSVVLTERADVGMLSAYDLVALGRHPYTDWTGRLSERDHAAVERALAAVRITPLAHRSVNELSDGERQKVMIARAFAQDAAIMLLDEPTAFLDLPRRVEIMDMLRRVAHDDKRAVLLSTHDLDLALRTADRFWLLGGDGQIHIGAPEDLILNGAFEAAFRDDGVQFDTSTGGFTMPLSQTRSIRVNGEGVAFVWTIRALERIGCWVDDAAVDHIDVIYAHERQWIGTLHGVRYAWHSIEAMCAALVDQSPRTNLM